MSDCQGNCQGGSCGQGDECRLPPGMLAKYDLNASTADGLVVWLEISKGTEPSIERSSLEILSKARKEYEGRIFGIMFGDIELKPLYSIAFSYGVDTIYHVKDKRLIKFHPEAYSSAMKEVIERVRPAMILIGATSRGKETAPRLAALLETGLSSNCIGFSIEGNRLLTRSLSSGGDRSLSVVSVSEPQMATIRPGTFPMNDPSERREGTVIYWQYRGNFLKDILNSNRISKPDPNISEAKVIIALGNGIKDRNSIKIAESVASKIGGKVCCSGALIRRGWFQPDRQVGIAGITVSPEIYLAFGISGAIEHLAGIKGAKKIIAINIDKDASIQQMADLFIIGDADSILKRLDEVILQK